MAVIRAGDPRFLDSVRDIFPHDHDPIVVFGCAGSCKSGYSDDNSREGRFPRIGYSSRSSFPHQRRRADVHVGRLRYDSRRFSDPSRPCYIRCREPHRSSNTRYKAPSSVFASKKSVDAIKTDFERPNEVG